VDVNFVVHISFQLELLIITTGVYLWFISPLVVSDFTWGASDPPHGYRWCSHLLCSISQHQLPPRVPLL